MKITATLASNSSILAEVNPVQFYSTSTCNSNLSISIVEYVEQQEYFLRVYPQFIWAEFYSKEVSVESNTSWIVY